MMTELQNRHWENGDWRERAAVKKVEQLNILHPKYKSKK